MNVEQNREHNPEKNGLYLKKAGVRGDTEACSFINKNGEHKSLIIGIGLLMSCLVFVACAASDESDTEQDAKDNGKSSDTAYVPPDGEPIEGNDLEWIWVDVPGSVCRDGSPTGFAVNMNKSSDKLIILYEGGGACYNAITCLANPTNASSSNFVEPNGGVFNRNRDENPVKDWNFVFFPYCSGDVFGGDAEGDPGGTGVQQFRGYRNVSLFLDRIVPTFPDVTHVFTTGVSAGAIGVGVTAKLFADKFPPGVKMSIIADSCPPMDKQYVPQCLQKQWRELWNFDDTFLTDCGTECPDPDNYMIDIISYFLKKYEARKVTAAVLSSTEDPLIRFFYGFGNNDCNPESPIYPNMPADKYTAGLLDMRSLLEKYPQFGTYFFGGADHTWVNSDDKFYNLTVNGVRLVDWTRDIIEGKASHVGP